MQGVVFNAHWLTYFDDAMTRFFEWLGHDTRALFLDSGFDCMLVKAVVEWAGPAGWEDDVAIAVAPSRIGTASFDIRFEASVEGRAACAATITYVSVKRGTHETQPVPAEIRSRLEAVLA